MPLAFERFLIISCCNVKKSFILNKLGRFSREAKLHSATELQHHIMALYICYQACEAVHTVCLFMYIVELLSN